MSTKERILAIHLIEKLNAYPQYGKLFGIEVIQAAPPDYMGIPKRTEE